MDISQHIESLSTEGHRLAAAAREAGPEASVPTCPGWQVRDLLRHTSMVHRWATAFVTEGYTVHRPADSESSLDGNELLDWFTEGHGLLVDALSAAPADLECWTFMAAPSPLAFWARRQAHETMIHRVDAESARGGTPTPVPSSLAADGIDELLTGFHGRAKSRVRTEVPRTLRVSAPDAGAVWTVHMSTEPPRAVRGEVGRAEETVDCEVSGTAHELCLALWNRLPLSAVALTGDPAVAELWAENSGITWS